MRLSMVMIVKDAAADLRETFDSFWADVDEVILLDTGSTDETINAAKQYAGDDNWREITHTSRDPARPRKRTGHKLVIAHFKWTDDFAAARNCADSLATGEWLSWADHDDSVVGMANLRKVAEDADPRINAFYLPYHYAVTDDGVVICELIRERLVRRGAGEWIDRVHESQVIHGGQVQLDGTVATWVHRKPPFSSSERNTLILERWVEDEPTNPRVLANLARDYMSNSRWKDAVPVYERYLAVPGQPKETRAQATRQLCQALCQIGRFEWAHTLSIRTFGDCPAWPDTYLTLAELAAARFDWRSAVQHAETVIRLGKPESMLILNPQDYDERPRALIATAAGAVGEIDKACELAEEVLSKSPGFLDLERQLAGWQSTRQMDQTAGMWAQCAGLLVAYDEPLKAEALLETVPHYSRDHPHVIAARVQAREALDEPYQVEKVDGARGEFLLRGLHEQAEAWEKVA